MTQAWQSNRVAAIVPSATLAMTDRVKQMRAAGRQVIGLTTGTPDFDTPAYIKAAGKAALDEDRTYVTYTMSAGLPESRAAIAAKLAREHLNNILDADKVDADSVIRKFRITAADGKSQATNPLLAEARRTSDS